MQPEKVSKLTWGATLRLERVAEGHRVVVTMPESFSDLAQARSVLFKQGGVSVAEYVPAHTGLLEWAKGVVKDPPGLRVGHRNGEIEALQYALSVLIERDEAFAPACLRAVYASAPVPGPPDVQEAIDNIVSLYGHGLTDAQARQQAQLREEAPLAGHPADHLEQVTDGDVMPALHRDGDAKPLRWNW